MLTQSQQPFSVAGFAHSLQMTSVPRCLCELSPNMTQQQRFKWLRRLFFFLTPLLLGVAVLVVSLQLRAAPERRDVEEVAQPLRVITIRKVPVVPRAFGIGESQPKQTWQAICEVKGRIVEVHPQLKPGGTISKEEPLLRIDDADVHLMISRLKAEIARAKASLAELNANEANYRESLQLEEESLKVANTEMERTKQLASRNASSAAELDSKRRALITQKQLVQSVRSKLNLLPTQVESAKAALQVAEANLAERQRDLQRCEIRAPFDCRLGAVTLEVGQYIGAGEKLFAVQSEDGIQIEAEFASQDLRRLFNSADSERTNQDGNDIADETVPAESRFQVNATVRYTLGGRVNECEGRFVRFREQLSDQARSGIVVIETDSSDRVADGPPLIRGTLCEIELSGRAKIDRIVVPQIAVRDQNSVFVIDGEKRLQRREVAIEFEQGDFVVIQSGLADGDTVVVSQPQSAIAGSLVEPLVDEALQDSIMNAATGSEPRQ